MIHSKEKRRKKGYHAQQLKTAYQAQIGDIWVHNWRPNRKVMITGFDDQYRIKLKNIKTGYNSISQLIFFSRDYHPQKS